MNNIDSKVKEALDRTEIMALATTSEDGSWVCPVKFTYDKNLNLYFRSFPNTKHVKNILKDPRVSVAIFKDVPFPKGGNLGLQIKGLAKQVQNQDDKPNSWHQFKIVPVEVWVFDSRIKREREKVDLQNWKS